MHSSQTSLTFFPTLLVHTLTGRSRPKQPAPLVHAEDLGALDLYSALPSPSDVTVQMQVRPLAPPTRIPTPSKFRQWLYTTHDFLSAANISTGHHAHDCNGSWRHQAVLVQPGLRGAPPPRGS